jgi:hypothetical protein
MTMPPKPKANRRQASAPKRKRPRGALLRAIIAGNVSTSQAHRDGYMSRAEILAKSKSG